MERFTVKQLAAMAGISVRALHHYDRIGLLKPLVRSEANYRYYGREECLRLQQILLYRELELPLAAIQQLLDDPDFDAVQALESHRQAIKRQRKRLQTILETVDHTLVALKAKQEKMDYTTLYKGLAPETAQAYRQEAEERWGKDTIAASHERLLALTKGEWEALLAFGEEVNRQLAACVTLDPADKHVQELIALHYGFVGKHFDVTPEIYANLGQLYAEDERFRAYYDNYDERLADFLRAAIAIFTAK